MTLIKLCNKIIEYTFYAIFFLVPLAFTDKTSELFEFNKMWVTFGFTIVIATFWICKMILHRRILFCRTPLDIPIILFLISQFISTISSLDTHTSIWGYYSRFNGGFLSILSYIFLYYAFISNLSHLGNLFVKRILLVSLLSGLVVALWGLPSHFGYDPTCLMFRGTFDVSCWTDAFQPKIRIFSTLGQPNWLAAYLAILLPIAIAMAIKLKVGNEKLKINEKKSQMRPNKFSTLNFQFSIYLLLTVLFFLDLLYTRSNSGFLGLMGGILLFLTVILLNSTKSTFNKMLVSLSSLIIFSSWILLKWKDIKIISLFSTVFIILFLAYFIYASFKSKDSILYKFRSALFLSFGALIIISLFIGTPMTPKIQNLIPKLSSAPAKTIEQPKKDSQPQGPALEVGGTDSGTIRLIVWRGAIDIWRAYPIFGSGVETYAYAYYKFRLQSHNMTSEWDYLYNKAHNEYLNYLATTGIFGLGSYLLMIGSFFFIVFKKLKSQSSNLKTTTQISKPGNEKLLTLNCNFELYTLNFALLASYASILISNFFGFSVVIVNLYMFMIPAFVFILNNQIKLYYSSSEAESRVEKHQAGTSSRLHSNNNKVSAGQKTAIFFTILTSSYLIFNLFRFWQADIAYAMGNNLDKVGQYQEAYTKLHEAVNTRGSEPVFKDELTYNNAVLATAILSQKPESITPDSKQTAGKLIQEAIQISNDVVSSHPNNIVSWKTRVRMFYTLSRVQPQFLKDALISISKASELAPTDAKIYYNLGILYGQSGNPQKAIEVLRKTVELKPDYRDAYYALGLFYREAAVDKNQKVIKPELQQKAVETMRFILANFSAKDGQALQALESWGEK